MRVYTYIYMGDVLVKLLSSVTSYTSRIPMAPR